VGASLGRVTRLLLALAMFRVMYGSSGVTILTLRGVIPKNFHPKTSYKILRHMHRVLNVDETKKLIAQFTVKSRDESFKAN
jgi:hypothetical protein